MYLSYNLHALKEEQMKAIKYLFFLLFLLFGVLAFAADWNCKINLPPNPQNYPKELLLRMMYVNITNSEHQSVTVYLHGEVRRDGKLIGKGNSNKIEIPPGGKRITRSDITKIEKEWWDKEFEKLLFRLPTLPAGDYEACIFVYKAKGKKLLTKCCTEFESKPVSPPRLISPKDGATLKEKYPLFRWTPPNPTFPGVTYTLRIVEVPKGMPESISEEELQLCPTTHEEKGITRTSFKYPSSAKELEEGKRYAWQVIAVSEAYEICKSEIWTYSFSPSDTMRATDNWTFEIKHIEKGKSAALAILKNGEPQMVVYEEFIGENRENLFVAIWPPCYWIICPWPPEPIPPWPPPWRPDWLREFEKGSRESVFRFEEELPTHLRAIIHNAPLIIITETHPTSISKYDMVGVHLKINDTTYSGYIDLWKSPYTEQPFFKFIEHQKKLGQKFEEEKRKRRHEKGTPPGYFWENLVDSFNFSKNCLTVKTLPENTSFGALVLWENGITSTPYIKPEEGRKKVCKISDRAACAVATGLGDAFGYIGTALVGAVNQEILSYPKK